jgi:hypothetical protein
MGFKVLSLLGVLDVVAALIVRHRVSNSTSMVRDYRFSSTSLSNATSMVRDHQSNSTSQATSQAPWLFFDFGFFNGMDSWAYLGAGHRVVAVEADPTLVLAGQQNPWLQPFLLAGTLQILNYAIAPSDVKQTTFTTFYMNKCTKEWNSFYPDVGCRSCTPPHPEDLTRASCDQKQVTSTPCSTVFQTYGIPVYMKADMEGAESGCYKALEAYPVQQRPNLISGEVDDPDLVGIFSRLGYTSFKVVRQQSGHSGAYGDNAMDCRIGAAWRSYTSAAAELAAILDKTNIRPITDPCPSLVGGFGVWYDVHASRLPPQVM